MVRIGKVFEGLRFSGENLYWLWGSDLYIFRKIGDVGGDARCVCRVIMDLLLPFGAQGLLHAASRRILPGNFAPQQVSLINFNQKDNKKIIIKIKNKLIN